MLGVVREHARIGFGEAGAAAGAGALDREVLLLRREARPGAAPLIQRGGVVRRQVQQHAEAALAVFQRAAPAFAQGGRSAERRVGNEWVSPLSSRLAPDYSKKKNA